MALSVGLGRIVNDPDAPIRTRKALGRLSTPGLLVTDEGLTINTDGRIVLRLSRGLIQGAFGLAVNTALNGGIYAGQPGAEDESGGLAIRLPTNSGLQLSDEGLALADELGDRTFTNITVSQNATITGTLDTTLINSDTIINTGAITSDSLNVTGNASVGGTLTVATISIVTLAVSGNANIAGLATIGNLAVTGSVGIGGSASVGGSINAATGVIGDNQLTALGLISGAIEADSLYSLNTLYVTGNSVLASNVNISGNLTVAGTITGGGGAGVPIFPSTVTIGGGTTITRIRSFFVTSSFSGGPGTYPLETFFGLPGVSANAGLMCSIVSGSYGGGFASWSAAMRGSGSAMIRVMIVSTAVYSVTVTFRVTAIETL